MNTVIVDNRFVEPSKIVCIGRNYVAHIEELGNAVPDDMVVFNKPNSAIGDTLRAELGGEQIHYEAELCFAVEAGTLAAVGVGLDLTKRDLQDSLKQAGLPWERAKAFDGSVLFSEFVPLPNTLDKLSLRLMVDGQQRQAGGVALMMHKPTDMIEQVQDFMSLEDGDIFMTGTPAGVGPVRVGELFHAEVLDGIKVLTGRSWQAA